MSDYDDDFLSWTRAQAAALRQGAWTALDIEHLAEEIEDMGKRDQRAVESYLEVILLHLLKWQYQPSRRGRSWQRSLLNARHRLVRLLQDNTRLNISRGLMMVAAYRHARRLAALETSLPLATFPQTCPWPLEQVLDEDFWPEG